MWATEDERLTGVTFDSDGHRLLGVLYLARGEGLRPLLVVHGTADRWVPVTQARELRERAGPGCRYVEVEGADHAFSWHRAELADLVVGWLRGECCAT